MMQPECRATCRQPATLAGWPTGRGDGERLEYKVLRTLRFGAELPRGQRRPGAPAARSDV